MPAQQHQKKIEQIQKGLIAYSIHYGLILALPLVQCRV
jgi:hypothetical protein